MFINKTFNPDYISTIGVEIKVFRADINGASVKAQLWDPGLLMCGIPCALSCLTSLQPDNHGIELLPLCKCGRGRRI